MKAVYLFISALILFSSCQKRKLVQSEQGGIDIISNFYFDASKGLDNVKSVLVSKINYKGNNIIEFVPHIDFPELINKTYFIHDSLYYDISGVERKQFVFSQLEAIPAEIVYSKEHGVLYTKKELPNFGHRKNLPDTVLFKKNYKRFEINGFDSYTVFYVHKTDTVLPYAIYANESDKYKGRIERIDSYSKEKDIFISLQLIPRKEWDEEAKEIFDFNEFVQNRNNR